MTELAVAFPLFNDSDKDVSLGRRHQVNLSPFYRTFLLVYVCTVFVC